MRYFFYPGTFEQLSIAELKALAPIYLDRNFQINSKSRDFFIVETSSEQDEVLRLFNRLGGFIKLSVEIDQESFFNEIIESGKKSLDFGISYYAEDGKEKSAKLANNIKKLLKSAGIKSRFIVSDSGELTSAQIANYSLIDKGFELNIARVNDIEIASRTIAVQDFEGYIERDRNKPEIDVDMGVLPPKLARIMVNLTGVREGETIWDPFCGSGNILLEGLMSGLDVLGSDVDHLALDFSRKNINWLANKYDLNDRKYNVFHYDVVRGDKKVESKLRKTNISAVVFEPYMGPPQRRLLNTGKAERLLSEVQKLLSSTFQTLEHIKAYELVVVGILPEYKTYDGWLGLRYNSFLSKKWKVTADKGLHWERKNSIIRRNIFVARLKK